MVVDASEAARRAEFGLGAVTSLGLLDVLLGLPLGCPIRLEDLSKREMLSLRAAPAGCVEFSEASVLRRLQAPATVVAAVVRGGSWSASLKRTAPFFAFTQRIIALPEPPGSANVMEAQMLGIGIWIESRAGGFEEHLAPEPFEFQYFKAASWRFAEKAYAATQCSDRRPEASEAFDSSSNVAAPFLARHLS